MESIRVFGLKWDKRARVPFALVAILLLVTVGILSVYVTKLGQESNQKVKENISYYAMNQEIDKIEWETKTALEEAGYIAGDTVLKDFTDLSTENSIIYTAVIGNRMFDYYMKENYEKRYNQSGYEVDVYLHPTSYTNYSSDEETDRKDLEGIVEEAELQNQPRMKRGFEIVYLYLEVPNGSKIDLEQVPAYMHMNRTVTITIRNRDLNTLVSRTVYIEKDIKTPYFVVKFLQESFNEESVRETMGVMLNTISYCRAYSKTATEKNKGFPALDFIYKLDPASLEGETFKNLIEDGAGDQEYNATVDGENVFNFRGDRGNIDKSEYIDKEDVQITFLLSFILEEIKTYHYYDMKLIETATDMINNHASSNELTSDELLDFLGEGNGIKNKVNVEALTIAVYSEVGLVDTTLYTFAPFIDKISEFGFLKLVEENWGMTLVSLLMEMFKNILPGLLGSYISLNSFNPDGIFKGMAKMVVGLGYAVTLLSFSFLTFSHIFDAYRMDEADEVYTYVKSKLMELSNISSHGINIFGFAQFNPADVLIDALLWKTGLLAKVVDGIFDFIFGDKKTWSVLIPSKYEDNKELGALIFYILFFGPFKVDYTDSTGLNTQYNQTMKDYEDNITDDANIEGKEAITNRITEIYNKINEQYNTNKNNIITTQLDDYISDMNAQKTCVEQVELTIANTVKDDMKSVIKIIDSPGYSQYSPYMWYEYNTKGHTSLWDSLKSGIETLKNDRIEVEGEIASLDSHISSLNNEISSLNSEISTLNNEISSLNSEISNLWDDYDYYEGKISSDPDNASYWQDKMEDCEDEIDQKEAERDQKIEEIEQKEAERDQKESEKQQKEDEKEEYQTLWTYLDTFIRNADTFKDDAWEYEAWCEVGRLVGEVPIGSSLDDVIANNPSQIESILISLGKAADTITTFYTFNEPFSNWDDHSNIGSLPTEPQDEDMSNGNKIVENFKKLMETTGTEIGKENFDLDIGDNKYMVQTGLSALFWLVNHNMFQLKNDYGYVASVTDKAGTTHEGNIEGKGMLYQILAGDFESSGSQLSSDMTGYDATVELDNDLGILNSVNGADMATVKHRWVSESFRSGIANMVGVRSRLQDLSTARSKSPPTLSGIADDEGDTLKYMQLPSFYNLSTNVIDSITNKMVYYGDNISANERGLYTPPDKMEEVKDKEKKEEDVEYYPIIQAPIAPLRLHFNESLDSEFYKMNLTVTTDNFGVINTGKENFENHTLVRQFNSTDGTPSDECFQYLDPFSEKHIDYYITNTKYQINTSDINIHIKANGSAFASLARYRWVENDKQLRYTNSTTTLTSYTPVPLIDDPYRPVSALAVEISDVELERNVYSDDYVKDHPEINVTFGIGGANGDREFKVRVIGVVQNKYVPSAFQGMINIFSGLFGSDEFSNYKFMTDEIVVRDGGPSDLDDNDTKIKVSYGDVPGEQPHWDKLGDDRNPLFIVHVSTDMSFQALVSAYCQKELVEDKKTFSIVPAMSVSEQVYMLSSEGEGNPMKETPLLPVFDVSMPVGEAYIEGGSAKGKECDEWSGMDNDYDYIYSCDFRLIDNIPNKCWIVDKGGMMFLVAFDSHPGLREMLAGQMEIGKTVSSWESAIIETVLPTSLLDLAFTALLPSSEYKLVKAYDFVPVQRAVMNLSAKKRVLDVHGELQPGDSWDDILNLEVSQGDFYNYFPDRAVPINFWRPGENTADPIWNNYVEDLCEKGYKMNVMIDPKIIYSIPAIMGKLGVSVPGLDKAMKYVENGIQIAYGSFTGFIFEEGLDFKQGMYVVYDMTRPTTATECIGAADFAKNIMALNGMWKDVNRVVEAILDVVSLLSGAGLLAKLGKIGTAIQHLGNTLKKFKEIVDAGAEAYLSQKDPEAYDRWVQQYVMTNISTFDEGKVEEVRTVLQNSQLNGNDPYSTYTISMAVSMGYDKDTIAEINAEISEDDFQATVSLDADIDEIRAIVDAWEYDGELKEFVSWGFETYDEYNEMKTLIIDGINEIDSTASGISDVIDEVEADNQDTVRIYDSIKVAHTNGLGKESIEAILYEGSNFRKDHFLRFTDSINDRSLNISGMGQLLNYTTECSDGDIEIVDSYVDTAVEVNQRISRMGIKPGEQINASSLNLAVEFISFGGYGGEEEINVPVILTDKGACMYLNLSSGGSLQGILVNVIPELNSRATINVTVSPGTGFESVTGSIKDVLEIHDPFGSRVSVVNVHVSGEGYAGRVVNGANIEVVEASSE